MAYIQGERDSARKECRGCHQVIVFTRMDLRHYRHDVEGNNVYVQCPACGVDVQVYRESADKGWVERDPL